jgi:hypothetical protein
MVAKVEKADMNFTGSAFEGLDMCYDAIFPLIAKDWLVNQFLNGKFEHTIENNTIRIPFVLRESAIALVDAWNERN